MEMEIICETSMRHAHLSKADVEALFGKGVTLECERMLSQPGQFLCKQRINLVGPKSSFTNVGIIGPERKESQVEISKTDAFALGVKEAPLRMSGDTEGAPNLVILDPSLTNSVSAPVIIAKRHAHLDPETAEKWGITDKQIIKVRIDGERATILDEVVARIDKNFAPAIHIDADEANATYSPKNVTILL